MGVFWRTHEYISGDLELYLGVVRITVWIMATTALGPWFPGHHVDSRPEEAALVFDPGGLSMTFRDVDDTANRMARFLRDQGLAVGEHICFWLDNELQYPALWW